MLTTCPSCHQSISVHALFCPHCGDNFARFRKARLQRQLFFWSGILFLFFALLCTYAAIEACFSPPPLSTPQEAQDWMHESLVNALMVWGIDAVFWLGLIATRTQPTG